MVLITIVTGANLNQLITGGPHIVLIVGLVGGLEHHILGISSSQLTFIFFRGVQCGAPKIAKLVYNSNNYGLWYANNYSIHGVYKPTNITGGPHIVGIVAATLQLL